MGVFFQKRRFLDEIITTQPDYIVSGLKILALYFFQLLMVTVVSLERHPMFNKVEIIIVVAHQVVVVILIKADTYRGRFVLLFLS